MAQIKIDILAEARKARSEIQGVGTDLGGMQKKASLAGGVFKGALGAGLVGAGIAAAGKAVGAFTSILGDSVEEARESEKVGKTTEAVIKATGGAAKISADQVGELAGKLSEKAGMDDELIQSGANLLLTFKNVRNEAGKGGAIFDRATASAVDLSAAGFGSVEGASKMLGKALNDPVKGISALGRAGVTFTAGQKEQIKALAESGDMLGAQKIILGEVESQVGGVAAANATAGEKMAVTWGNLKEQLGTSLLPVLDQFADFFTTTLGPAISRGLEVVGPLLAKIGPGLTAMATQVQGAFTSLFGGEGGGGLAAARAQLEPFITGLSALGASVQERFAVIAPIVQQVFGALVSGMQSATTGSGAAGSALSSLGSILSSLGTINSAITSAMKAAWDVLGPGITIVAQTVGRFLVQYLGGALEVVAGIFKTVAAVLKGDWSGAWEGIKQIMLGGVRMMTAQTNLIKGIFTGLGTAVVAAARKLGAGLASVWGSIKAGASSAWNGLRSAVLGIVSGFVAGVTSTVRRVVGMLASVWSSVRGSATSAWNGIRSAVTGAVSGLVAAAVASVRRLVSGFSSAWSSVRSGASSAMSSLRSAVSSGVSSVVSSVAALPGRARSALGSVGSALSSAGGDLVRGFIRGMTGAIGAVADTARRMASSAINAAKSALSIASPSKVFIELGKYVGQGLAIGIQGTRSQVDTAVKTLTSKVTAKFKADADANKKLWVDNGRSWVKYRQGQVRASESAAKRIKTIDGQIAGLKRGGVSKKERSRLSSLERERRSLKGTADALRARQRLLKTAEGNLARYNKRDTGAEAIRRADALLKRYKKTTDALKRNASARDAVSKTLAEEHKQLNDMRKVRDDYVRSVRDAAVSYADVTKIEAPENTALTSKTLLQGLRDRLNAVTNFRDKIYQLRKQGLNETTLEQIYAAGVEGGMDTVNALVTGGSSAVKEINSLQKKINAEAQGLGTGAGKELYQAGLDMQRGLVLGLMAKEDQLEKAAKSLASKLTAAVKKQLGIKSPSRVFREVGLFTTQGLIEGLDERKVKLAGKVLAGELVDGFARPSLATPVVTAGGAAGAGRAPVNVYFSVEVPLGTSRGQVGREILGALRALEQETGQKVLVKSS